MVKKKKLISKISRIKKMKDRKTIVNLQEEKVHHFLFMQLVV